MFKLKKLLFVFLIVLFLSGCSNSKFGKVCFESSCFDVELATTPFERERGLMDRDFLDFDNGILFVFEKEGIYGFWMKNTLIPLDIIWIDSRGVVVFIEENVKLCVNECSVFTSDKEAKYVLEVNSGIVEKIDLKVWDKLELNV